MADDKPKKEEVKKKPEINEAQKKHTEKRDNYADKMWDTIEKKAKSKSERTGLKGDLKEAEGEKQPKAEGHADGVLEGTGKKRRRRRKSKPKTEETPDTQTVQKTNEPVNPFAHAPVEPAKPSEEAAADVPKVDTPKADVPKTDTPKADVPKVDAPKADIPKTDVPKTPEPASPFASTAQPVAPTAPTQPINPFAQASQTDSGIATEHEGYLEPKDEGDQELPPVEEVEKPANPFAQASDKPAAKTLDNKAFGNKPAEAVGHKKTVDEPKAKEEESDDAVEEAKLAKESHVKEAEVVEPPKLDDTDASDGPPEMPGAIVGEVVESEKKDIKGHVQTEAGADEFKEEIWDVLAQAGVTKKRIVIVILVIVAVIVGIIFYPFGGGDKVKRGEKPDEIEVEVEEPDQENTELVSSYIIGEEFKPLVAEPITTWGTMDPVNANVAVGSPEPFGRTVFAKYVSVLRSIKNVYNTDVYDLVNKSVNRRAAIDKHIDLMGGIIDEGRALLNQIDSDLINLSAQYTAITGEIAVHEEQFYLQVERLEGESAYKDLDEFMQLERIAVDIKAQHAAEQVVRDILVDYLNAVIPRHEDIVVNKEAVIKGVRVIDIFGSDIEAIILEQN